MLVHGHEVYIGTDRGVAIVSLKCRGACEPIGWLRSDANGPRGFGSLTGGSPNSYAPRVVAGGDVIVEIGWDGAASSGVFPSSLAGYALGCRGHCQPDWTTPVEDGRQYSPAVAGDEVLAPRIGALDAFACAPSPETCGPQWTGITYPRPDITWTTTPLIVGDTVLVSTQGCVCGGDSQLPIVAAYPLTCSTGGGRCDPNWRWTFQQTRFLSDLSIHDGVVYALTQQAGGKRRTEGLGFDVDCTGSCSPVVHLVLGRGRSWGAPVFSGGMLFVPRAWPGGVLAFDASCRGVCRPLSSSLIQEVRE